MFKRSKLYSLSPLLAAILLMGAIGVAPTADYEKLTNSDEEIFALLPMSGEDISPAAHGAISDDGELLDWNLVLADELYLQLFEDSDEVHYDLIADGGELILLSSNESSPKKQILSTKPSKSSKESKSDKLLASFTLIGHGYYPLEESDSDERDFYRAEIHIDVVSTRSRLFNRLRNQEPTYFRLNVSEDADEVRFEVLPKDGIAIDEVEDDDLFCLVNFHRKLIRVRVKDGASLKPGSDKSHKTKRMPTKAPQKKPRKPKPRKSKPSTAAPTPMPTPAPTLPPPPPPSVNKTAMDYAREEGYISGPDTWIFDNYAEAETFLDGCLTEYSQELNVYRSLSPEEQANFNWNSLMGDYGFTRYDFFDRQNFAVIIFYH
ncbi:MAG: hypothetical protein Q4P72_03055 [Eubacteriales bacterium]|nr:hypothetical protein [Eubacteriales bacterium]